MLTCLASSTVHNFLEVRSEQKDPQQTYVARPCEIFGSRSWWQRTTGIFFYIRSGVKESILFSEATWTWVNFSAWVCLGDTHDVVLWLCSGFCFKYTFWTHHAHKHTSRKSFDQSPCVSSPKAALTLNQECGGLDCVHPVCACVCEVLVCVCMSDIVRGSAVVSVHDIMRCNERKLAALRGNQISFTPVGRGGRC